MVNPPKLSDIIEVVDTYNNTSAAFKTHRSTLWLILIQVFGRYPRGTAASAGNTIE